MEETREERRPVASPHYCSVVSQVLNKKKKNDNPQRQGRIVHRFVKDNIMPGLVTSAKMQKGINKLTYVDNTSALLIERS